MSEEQKPSETMALDSNYRMIQYFDSVQKLIKGCVFHGESLTEVAKVSIQTDSLKEAMVKALKEHPDYEAKKLDYPLSEAQ